MEKNSKDSFKTGAKKAGKIISILALATTLTFANAQTASAYVDAENIIGEEQTVEDRTEIKRSEANAIGYRFLGYDYWGDRFVTPEKVEKAIEMSNALNAYNNYEVNEYSNTRPSEVLNLDIDRLYNEYQTYYKNDHRGFCRRNIDLKPALDAYLNFACGTIFSEMKEEIEEATYVSLYNNGYNVTGYPKVTSRGDKIYCIVKIDNHLELIEVNTENVSRTNELMTSLDNRYNLCLRNISGKSDVYPNTFAYNGIDTETNESAWLSLCDDELKQLLTESINHTRDIETNLNIIIGNERYYISDISEIKMLESFGISETEIRNAVKAYGSLSYEQQLVK